MKRILIVDDHPIVREGFAARISRQPDLEICGEAADVDEAMARIRALQPDLVLVDLSLKAGHGLDLIKQIKSWNEDIKVLVVSMLEESLYAERAFRAGASGYVNKEEAADKMMDAIRQILDGKMFMSADLSALLIQRSLGKPSDQGESPVERLSDRELEIFELIGQGRTTRQIADEIHLSLKTVETHRENIKHKLQIGNSAELSRQAVQWVLENRQPP